MATAKEVQQNFYENLGNREYDCFQSTEEKYLKLKIGFTLFGLPESNEQFNNLNCDYTVAHLYNDKQNKVINKIHSVIKSQSIYNEDSGQVIVSFMFNCCEFPNKKKNDNEEEKNNLYCYPIYKVKKCTGSPTNQNCAAFIDEHCRVYKNWDDYLETNKIPKTKMTVPKDGKYKGNMNGEVEIQELLSPACALTESIVEVADISTVAASIVTGGIGIASLIPAVTVAPIVLTGSLLTGVGIGIYSIIRSSFALHDRRIHSQSMSLANAEVRSCYFNIATGAAGVVTTGATKLASVAINRGVTIGEGAAIALLSTNAVNMTVNGCNIANSVYTVIKNLINKKNPTALDMLHLTTTILFFGNAVINLKSACVIYKDTQTRSVSELIQSRRQDLWNRAKSRFFNSDMTKTNNNKNVNVINDSSDYCSNIINFTAHETGQGAQNANLLINFIREIDVENIISLGLKIIENKSNVHTLCNIILSRFDLQIQNVLLTLLKFLIKNTIGDVFDHIKIIFPKTEIVVIFLNFIINFFKFKVCEMEIEYHQKKASAMKELNLSEEEYDSNCNNFNSNSERMMYFLKIIVLKMICENGKPEEILFREIVKYFYEWMSEKIVQYTLEISTNKTNEQRIISRKRVLCNDCGGHYYIN